MLPGPSEQDQVKHPEPLLSEDHKPTWLITWNLSSYKASGTQGFYF